MIKFSKLTWIILSSFFCALVCVMLNTVLDALVYPALALFAVGFVLLAIKMGIRASKKEKEAMVVREELLMELATTEDGEEYVVKNSESSKKYRKMLRREKISNYMPVAFCGFVAALIIFLLVKIIFKF